MQAQVPKVAVSAKPQEHWITVFIHGTHGSVFSLLSLLKVAHGKINHTLYELVQKKVRSMNCFYKDRLMAGLGLHKFDVNEPYHCYTASAQSKIKAYDLLASHLLYNDTVENQTLNTYYTFGWSGILSHQARQDAAHELYEALSKELAFFKQQNITPKIRLICHSHGGNVCLNLAQLEKIDFANFYIDELVMYATPIQIETEHFCFLPMFKKVFNFYSDNDFVQGGDWISTKTRKSSQRINIPTHHIEDPMNRVIQGKIMIQRNMGTTQKPYQKNFTEKMGILMYGGQPTCPHYFDPTHVEFWRPNIWEKNPTLFHPIPTVMYTPIFMTIFDHLDMNDVDINLFADKKSSFAQFHVYEHDQHNKKPERVYRIPSMALRAIKKTLLEGLPQSIAYAFSITMGA